MLIKLRVFSAQILPITRLDIPTMVNDFEPSRASFKRSLICVNVKWSVLCYPNSKNRVTDPRIVGFRIPPLALPTLASFP